ATHAIAGAAGRAGVARLAAVRGRPLGAAVAVRVAALDPAVAVEALLGAGRARVRALRRARRRPAVGVARSRARGVAARSRAARRRARLERGVVGVARDLAEVDRKAERAGGAEVLRVLRAPDGARHAAAPDADRRV